MQKANMKSPNLRGENSHCWGWALIDIFFLIQLICYPQLCKHHNHPSQLWGKGFWAL